MEINKNQILVEKYATANYSQENGVKITVYGKNQNQLNTVYNHVKMLAEQVRANTLSAIEEITELSGKTETPDNLKKLEIEYEIIKGNSDYVDQNAVMPSDIYVNENQENINLSWMSTEIYKILEDKRTNSN
jgi:hypothetical protein